MFDLTLLRQGLRVLVVDADADSRKLLQVLFSKCEVEVIEASCIREALQIMQQTRPDLLISELLLPDGNGYALIEQVRAFEVIHNTSIPVIALTACAQNIDHLRAVSAGFCRYMTKPLDIDLLIDMVADIAFLSLIQYNLYNSVRFAYHPNETLFPRLASEGCRDL